MGRRKGATLWWKMKTNTTPSKESRLTTITSSQTHGAFPSDHVRKVALYFCGLANYGQKDKN